VLPLQLSPQSTWRNTGGRFILYIYGGVVLYSHIAGKPVDHPIWNLSTARQNRTVSPGHSSHGAGLGEVVKDYSMIPCSVSW
jgi:hypothetical protein